MRKSFQKVFKKFFEKLLIIRFVQKDVDNGVALKKLSQKNLSGNEGKVF
jgi:hypothetical protein